MALSGTITTNAYLNRYYTLTWTATQSIEKNQSTISWALKAVGRSGEWFAERTLIAKLGGVTLISKTDRVERYDGTIKTGTFTVTHDSVGEASLSGSLQVAVYTSSVNCTGSGSWTLNSIPRQASLLTAEDFTDEENPTITYNNPAGNVVTSLQACISFDGSKDDIAYRDIDISGSSYTFELTDDERNVLLNGTLSGRNSREVTFFVRTIISGNTLYSTLRKTFTVVNATPTISPTVEDTNSTTLALTGSKDIFVRYYSNAKIAINAKAYKNASITSRKAICGSKSISTDSGTISGVESGSFAFTASDNRGNTVIKPVQASLIEYFKLSCSLTANPSDAEGNLKFSVDGTYYNNTFGSKDNSLSLEYCYNENGGDFTDWEAIDFTENGNKYSATYTISGLDYQNKYVVKVRATDLLSTETATSKVLKTVPAFDWGEHDFNFNVPVMISKGNSLKLVDESAGTEMDVGKKVGEIRDKLTSVFEYHCDSMTGLSVEDDTNAYIMCIVVKGNAAQLSLQAKTTTALSSWSNLLELNSSALAFLKEYAKPQGFVSCGVKDHNGNGYYFKYVGDTPYLWVTNSVASGISLVFTCTWIIEGSSWS